MLTPPPTFREALRMQKPAAWRFVLGAIWPLPDVIAWQARDEILDRLANDLGDHGPWGPGAHLVAHLQDLAGRDWPRLYDELRERWAKAP